MQKSSIITFKNELENKNGNLNQLLKDFDYDSDQKIWYKDSQQVKVFHLYELNRDLSEYKGGHLRREFLTRLIKEVMPELTQFLVKDGTSARQILFSGNKTAQIFFQAFLDRQDLCENEKQIQVSETVEDFFQNVEGCLSKSILFKMSKIFESDFYHTIFYKYKVNLIDTQIWILSPTQPRGKQKFDQQNWQQILN